MKQIELNERELTALDAPKALSDSEFAMPEWPWFVQDCSEVLRRCGRFIARTAAALSARQRSNASFCPSNR